GLQVAKNFRRVLLLVTFACALEFVFGSRRILAAVGAAELIERQRCAHPRPQNKEREVSVADVDDLGLEGVGRAQQAALPQIGLELDLTAELELQTLGHRERDAALGAHVSRRGHKYA